MQRLGDFDPGLEFKTAMVYADASIRPKPVAAGMVAAAGRAGMGAEGAGPGECAVVLGDRDVQETLRRLGGALTALTGRKDAGTEGKQQQQQQHGGDGVSKGEGARARAVSSESSERGGKGRGGLLGASGDVEEVSRCSGQPQKRRGCKLRAGGWVSLGGWGRTVVGDRG